MAVHMRHIRKKRDNLGPPFWSCKTFRIQTSLLKPDMISILLSNKIPKK